MHYAPAGSRFSPEAQSCEPPADAPLPPDASPKAETDWDFFRSAQPRDLTGIWGQTMSGRVRRARETLRSKIKGDRQCARNKAQNEPVA